MSLGKSSLPPPVINVEKPKNIPYPERPTNLSRFTILKQMLKTPNTRYVLFWVTVGFVVTVYGRRVVKQREQELMIEDVENYLKNKRN